MLEAKTFVDESQDHEFVIFLQEHQNGFTYELKIHGKDGAAPKVASSEELFESIDKARQAARTHAWDLINEIVKSSSQ
ncbi:hypothetical protein [Pseudomonas sp. St316]|uniref:hypothetical protein n=1 Tax=Pseudomonas sp. St316 TaxID=2678257 RepID=UPI001BB2F53D|nr:hypothetical protein [Pseudomonas sp. St316]BBP60412.1 hypothetical protein PHLH4_40020 [Pseudomonas sp. St316]